MILLASCFLIVYLFPKGGTFKYEFQKGKPWQHKTLYAPFDFSIIKTDSELEAEKKGVIQNESKYYRANISVVNEVQNSGYKTVKWDATNNQGQPVSAGVYLYSIEIGEFRQTKKMILLK